MLDALASGGHAGSLREYFGAPAYAELSALAAAAKAIKKSRGPRVLILPGIMGSKLGGADRAPRGAACDGAVDRSLADCGGPVDRADSAFR